MPRRPPVRTHFFARISHFLSDGNPRRSPPKKRRAALRRPAKTYSPMRNTASNETPLSVFHSTQPFTEPPSTKSAAPLKSYSPMRNTASNETPPSVFHSTQPFTEPPSTKSAAPLGVRNCPKQPSKLPLASLPLHKIFTVPCLLAPTSLLSKNFSEIPIKSLDNFIKVW